MTTKVKLKHSGVVFAFSLTVILVGFSYNFHSASADEAVPDWIKVIAGAWADEVISTEEFLNAINFLISNDIIQVPGYVSLDDLDCSETCQSSETICDDSVDNDDDGFTDCDDFDCSFQCS